jgi:hypothetical protein
MFVDDIMKRKYNSYKVNELGRTQIKNISREM